MNGQPLEDADIAQLVHDVADGWTMPPVRLDAPAWRERVRSPRARRVDAARGWLGRLGRAATAAVALTVAATIIAVVITLPPDPGKSPAPSDGSTPGATDAALATPLPKRLANGEVPAPSRVIVQTESGGFATVDLADGSIGGPFTLARPGSALQVRPDGSLMCLCVSESGSADGSRTTASVRLEHLEADGTPISTHQVGSFDGQPDPRDTGFTRPDPLPNVHVATSFSEGGRYGFVGWSRRVHPDWLSGLLVVDLLDGSVVSELDLPAMTTGDDDSRRLVAAPRIVGSAGDALYLGRSWEEFSPAQGAITDYRFGSDAFRISYPAGVLGGLMAVSGSAECGDSVVAGGALPDGGDWVACTSVGGQDSTVHRVAGDGEILPPVTVASAVEIGGDITALAHDRSALFFWNPASARLTRVDIATGESTTGDGLIARAGPGPLAAFGRWLAPVAAAKSFLQSSVIVSPDGLRVYAIGVKAGVESTAIEGSAGVFVFDASTLELLEIYQPTADFVSLAIGANGRFIYAAGLPGVDALGRRRGDQGASVTVFDTADGTTRVIAGQLGSGRITFGPEPLR